MMKSASRSKSPRRALLGRDTNATVREGTCEANGREMRCVPLRMPPFNVISGSSVTPMPPSTICTSVFRLVASIPGSLGARALQAAIA